MSTADGHRRLVNRAISETGWAPSAQRVCSVCSRSVQSLSWWAISRWVAQKACSVWCSTFCGQCDCLAYLAFQLRNSFWKTTFKLLNRFWVYWTGWLPRSSNQAKNLFVIKIKPDKWPFRGYLMNSKLTKQLLERFLKFFPMLPIICRQSPVNRGINQSFSIKREALICRYWWEGVLPFPSSSFSQTKVSV